MQNTLHLKKHQMPSHMHYQATLNAVLDIWSSK